MQIYWQIRHICITPSMFSVFLCITCRVRFLCIQMQGSKKRFHAYMGICMAAWGKMHCIRHCMCMVRPVICIN